MMPGFSEGVRTMPLFKLSQITARFSKTCRKMPPLKTSTDGIRLPSENLGIIPHEE
jgi:hypothetical protein